MPINVSSTDNELVPRRDFEDTVIEDFEVVIVDYQDMKLGLEDPVRTYISRDLGKDSVHHNGTVTSVGPTS